jgi:hypothetical protein
MRSAGFASILYPFAIEPTKDNLHVDPTGTPIPGAFIYSRRSLPLAEAAIAPPIDQTPIFLSTQGKTNLRDLLNVDFLIMTLNVWITFTDRCQWRHTRLSKHMLTTLTYQLLPIGVRSYPFFMMLSDIHSNPPFRQLRTRRPIPRSIHGSRHFRS